MIGRIAEGVVMLGVAGHLTRGNDPRLLLLACLLSVLAATASAYMLRVEDGGKPGRVRLAASVVAFASGMWTAQLLGLLALNPGLSVGIDPVMSVLSLVVGLGTAAGGFAFSSRSMEPAAILTVRGLSLIVGAGSTYLMGMSALLVPGEIHSSVLAAVVLPGLGGICAAAAVIMLDRDRRVAASLLLSLSVLLCNVVSAGLTRVSAAAGGVEASSYALHLGLGLGAALACLTILTLAVAARQIDDHLHTRMAREARRLRTLADTTFDGLIIERRGRIVDVNRAMCALSGSEAGTLLGLRLADLIPDIALAPGGGERSIEHVVLLPDGQTRPVEVSWRTDSDREGHVVAVRDLSSQKAAEAEIERLVRFDPLTGLANRDQLERQLRKLIAFSDRAISSVALLYFDLDRFDGLTDALGQATCEQILMQVARRLSETVGEKDTVGRMGEHEFCIIQSAGEQPLEAAALADRIVLEMASPFVVDGHSVSLTASVGIALHPADAQEAGDLIRNASLALRHTMMHSRGQWRYFEPGMDLLLRTKRTLEQDLLTALKEGQFTLNYQPYFDVASQDLAGYEALLRWDHPERGRIPPVDFIPLSEESGLIVPIGSWVLATACAEAASWADPLIISVNLSPAQFAQPGIVTTVCDVLRRTGLPPTRLELEITEGVLMDDTQNALRILNALKALGVKIAMDDFGTGYSSLSYLRKFPFDKIKIDRSFISDVEEDSEAETIVHAIIAMSRSLQLAVTAEGVETTRQLSMLRDHGCLYAQGYLLGRPSPADQLAHLAVRTNQVAGGQPRVRLAAPMGEQTV